MTNLKKDVIDKRQAYFEMAFWSALKIKTNNIIAIFFFFSDFYSIVRFKENPLPDS